uniref:Uncharacterized protein n=1 Tax=Oryza brachyantha TaxID=4533 RepID=J3LQE6_ORYBR
MSKPRGLLELMAAVDAGLVAVDDDGGARSAGRRRASYGRRRRQISAPEAVVVDTTPPETDDASFEFSAAVSYSSASPASMVFSDGQLRAHQFPAPVVRPSSPASGPQVASPALSSSTGTGGKGGPAGSKKSVSFRDGGAGRAAASMAGEQQQRTKGGGLLGCMGSRCTCGSSRNEVVEPGKNANRAAVAV